VVISTTYNRFAIVLTANATVNTPFALFVIN
jgi:hypothetical protein